MTEYKNETIEDDDVYDPEWVLRSLNVDLTVKFSELYDAKKNNELMVNDFTEYLNVISRFEKDIFTIHMKMFRICKEYYFKGGV